MQVKLDVPNRVDPDSEATLDVEIPIESMMSFDPLHVANAVPKLKGLLLVKKLLLEAQAALDNRKAFRGLVQALAQDPKAVEALKKSLKDHAGFQVPTSAKTLVKKADNTQLTQGHYSQTEHTRWQTIPKNSH